ncbi:uncharacterized protein LOC128221629 [Mya arenaria]|uniref:uncharacterized protein LOC128221629 n=1 Tax=Mya arenaria TaxID=6604 RepID=UPI0022E1D541|nr:uncharacterized protein LOC128221629 [Mya arenaria]
MTNYEFYQAVKPYIDDEVVEYTGIAVTDDGHVINLPGGPNNELDVEYLMEKMGLLDDGESADSEEEDSTLNPLQRLGARASCRCCMTVEYNRGKFTLEFVLNKRRMYRNAVNLRRVPRLCYRVPGLKLASVCLELYGIDIAQRRLCAKLVGTVDLKVKKFRVNFKLGCVSIPILKNAEGLYLGQDGAEMQNDYPINDDVADLAGNDDMMRYEADDVDMSSDDVKKPEDKLIALFITELWKSLTNMD